MPRRPRKATGNLVTHALNRAVRRMPLFKTYLDFAAFEQVLVEAQRRFQTRILSYCVMRNHWHLVVWPRLDGELSEFMQWLTMTHTQRWHARHGTTGTGPIYQGRYKSFPVQTDRHFLTVARYVERNPVRARLVKRAEDWRWSSLHRRRGRVESSRPRLAAWPLERPADWIEWVNLAETLSELRAVRLSVVKGAPYGEANWRERMAVRLDLGRTMRPRGRPRKEAKVEPRS